MAKLFDVIEYEGDNSTFVWKHPCEDFNRFTQLIVHENQEAIFFLDGQALDVFGPGRYTLKTQNLPIIGKLVNIPTGGTSPFHCEVYFINKTEQMAIRWGTSSRFQYLEPTYNFPVSLGACGEMSFQILDGKKLLVKLVGTEKELSQEKLVHYFRAILMVNIKSYIPAKIKEDKISIFETDENLVTLSNDVMQLLSKDMLDYGVSLQKFYITNILKPDGEPQYEKFKEIHFRQYADIAEAKLHQATEMIYAETEAQKTVVDSKAQATKRAQEGYTFAQERGFEVAEKVAENETVGELTNLGVGLGTMAGVGGTVGGMVGGMMNNAMASTNEPVPTNEPVLTNEPVTPAMQQNFTETTTVVAFCGNCGHKFQNDFKFCPVCGTKREGL